jgi:hypothetical protein
MTKRKFQESDFIDTCALRFDGYKYAEEVGHRFGPEKLSSPALLDKMVVDRKFCPELMDNLWAFFALQRSLGKWGGEYLTTYSDEHVLFKLLFLHLYTEEIPERYRMPHLDSYEKWESDYRPFREELAAIVRSSLRRRGRGPKTWVDPNDPGVKRARAHNLKVQAKNKARLIEKLDDSINKSDETG